MAGLPRRLNPLVAAMAGAAVFAVLAAATAAAGRAGLVAGSVGHQFVLKSALVLASVVLMIAIRRSARTWGLAAPRSWLGGTALPTIAGAVLGAVATGVIVGCDFTPMSPVRGMTLLQIVTVIWLGSTFAEEVFVRGLVQGWMQPLDGAGRGATARILASGLLFGAMHLSLFLGDDDRRTAATIVAATTLLGLVCAWSRERSQSLAGPLLAHFAFNAAGIVGGVAVMVARRVLAG